MAKDIEDEVAYYYDFHPTEEDLMGETSVHRSLIDYLALVLKWLLHGRLCAIYENLNFYQTSDSKEYPLAPDIAVIKGVSFQHVRSWCVGKNGPAPQVVFEIASEETWKSDLQEKPGKYARMGVTEYFAYDPNERPLGRKTARRLFGWHLDPAEGVMQEMLLRPDGSLWSSQLQSMLVPQGEYLRLYDRQGHLRLTQTEAEARRAEVLAEKLRSLGIDPDQL
jgi:Uma2 family endonuclease